MVKSTGGREVHQPLRKSRACMAPSDMLARGPSLGSPMAGLEVPPEVRFVLWARPRDKVAKPDQPLKPATYGVEWVLVKEHILDSVTAAEATAAEGSDAEMAQ